MRKDFGAKPLSYPQAVYIVSTWNEDGTANAMNAAWGGVSNDHEFTLCLSANHKTVRNLQRTGAFTISMGDAAHVAACDYVGLASGNRAADKLDKAGFTVSRSAENASLPTSSAGLGGKGPEKITSMPSCWVWQMASANST